MRQLNADLLDNYNSELQKDEIRIRYAHRLASDLVAAASGLERKFDLEAQEGKISPLQKSKYLAYAGELREHARRLDTIAQRYETEKLSGAFGSLEKTCAACHADVKAKP
jgi:cytochrome c556